MSQASTVVIFSHILLGSWTVCRTGNRKVGRIGRTGQCYSFCPFLFFLCDILSSHPVVLVPHFFTTRLRNCGHRSGEFGVYELILHSLSAHQTRLQTSQASQVTGTDLIPPTEDQTHECFIGMIFENDATMAISGPFRSVSTQLEGPRRAPIKSIRFSALFVQTQFQTAKRKNRRNLFPSSDDAKAAARWKSVGGALL